MRNTHTTDFIRESDQPIHRMEQYRWWTADEVAHLKKLRRLGLTAKQCAVRLRRSEWSVKARLARRHNRHKQDPDRPHFRRHAPFWSKDETELLHSLWDAGCTTREIADLMPWRRAPDSCKCPDAYIKRKLARDGKIKGAGY